MIAQKQLNKPIRKVARSFSWWLGISSLFAMSSGVCPCCGKPGCPVGAGLACIVGAVATLLMQNWKHMIKHILNSYKENSRQRI
jgi:hypothetical protein